MNVDIEKKSSKKQPFWRPIYEFIENSYFEVVKLFPIKLLNQYKNIPNEPQNIPNEIKSAFFKWLCNMVCMHKWLCSAEGSQMIKSKKKRLINITSEDNRQDQDVGLILIMIG